MKLSKFALYAVGLIVAIIAVAVVWFTTAKPRVDNAKMVAWITAGYTEQFCKKIYPLFANCTTMSDAECTDVATQQIKACIEEKKEDIPSSADQETAYKLYLSFADCFQSNMHSKILHSYAVDSDECKKILQ
ncbi:MAG TPA: hypothetical protein VLG38_00185 [Gammaproteobacteria bacterium]|nr:hypothetical protein [Gammaproteobacteria bacterium]